MARRIIFFTIVLIAIGLIFEFVYPGPKKIEEKPQANISVSEPVPNQEIASPVTIKGLARVFESQLNVRVKDASGKTIVEKSVMANSSDAGQFGPFEISLYYPLLKAPDGVIEAFDYSAKDGSEIDKVIVPVKFRRTEIATIKLFFGSSASDPQGFNCNKSYPAGRQIAKTQSLARVALEELLLGPTAEEKTNGFFTSINKGVKIQKLTVENRVARVDFGEALQAQVGGSCRVAAIRSQIAETLKQFPSVKDVVISIDGRTEDILQP